MFILTIYFCTCISICTSNISSSMIRKLYTGWRANSWADKLQKLYSSYNYDCFSNFACFLSSADFFQNQLFGKIISGIPSECQTVWNQIRPDVLSGLIWVQTVCEGYQQTTLVGKEFYDYFSNYQDLSKSIRAIREDNGTFYSLSNPFLLNKLFNTIRIHPLVTVHYSF